MTLTEWSEKYSVYPLRKSGPVTVIADTITQQAVEDLYHLEDYKVRTRAAGCVYLVPASNELYQGDDRDAKMVFDLNANYSRHAICGECTNCIRLARHKKVCLRALSGPHQPGLADDVRMVWNDCLEKYPCTRSK